MEEEELGKTLRDFRVGVGNVGDLDEKTVASKVALAEALVMDLLGDVQTVRHAFQFGAESPRAVCLCMDTLRAFCRN